MSHTDLMIDIETTGHQPGCGILSIAVVPFSAGIVAPDSVHFYRKILPSSNLEYQLFGNEDTLKWWAGQPAHIREEAHSGTADLKEVLQALADYMQLFSNAVGLWGNGATFDCPVLEAAYAATGFPIPWNFRQLRCYRTLNAYAPDWVTPQVNNAAHDAHSDAMFQAERAAKILKWIARK